MLRIFCWRGKRGIWPPTFGGDSLWQRCSGLKEMCQTGLASFWGFLLAGCDLATPNRVIPISRTPWISRMVPLKTPSRMASNLPLDRPKIFPPPAALKSAVWEHFGYGAGENGLPDKNNVMCKHCYASIKMSGGTTNMAKHMRCHHSEKTVDNSRSAGTGGVKRKQDSDPADVAK